MEEEGGEEGRQRAEGGKWRGIKGGGEKNEEQLRGLPGEEGRGEE